MHYARTVQWGYWRFLLHCYRIWRRTEGKMLSVRSYLKYCNTSSYFKLLDGRWIFKQTTCCLFFFYTNTTFCFSFRVWNVCLQHQWSTLSQVQTDTCYNKYSVGLFFNDSVVPRKLKNTVWLVIKRAFIWRTPVRCSADKIVWSIRGWDAFMLSSVKQQR